MPRPFGGDEIEIGRERRRQSGRARQRAQPFDAGFGLARLPRGLGGKVVEPASAMAVDHGEGLVLLPEMQQRRHQRQMLDDIGEIPGVIGVAVIHHPAIDEPPGACR